MLIYANRFYRCCHIILLSDGIGEVLLLPMLTAHQCWCENSRGATHLYSLCGLLDAGGSWGLLQLFLLLCLYWHSLLYRGYKGVKNETFLKSLPVYYCLATTGPVTVDMRPFLGTHPNLGAVTVRPCAMWWSKKPPYEPAVSVPYVQEPTRARKQGYLASLQMVRSMDVAQDLPAVRSSGTTWKG